MIVHYPEFLDEKDFHYWQPYKDVFFDYFFGQYKNEDTIVFFHPTEYGTLIEDKNFFNRVLEFCDQNNIDFTVWLGHHNNYSHKNLVNWKWFPALYTLHVENNLSKYTGKVTVNKLFTCYNYKARLHRCMLIDLLYKNNLQDLGYISWHNIYEDSKKSWQYNFKYFIPKKIVFDESFDPKRYLGHTCNHYSFYNSVFNIVTESRAHNIELSEKTFWCIWRRKPFLILGAKGIHSYLESYGIKKYPIFDYSFDNFDSLEDRVQGIVTNVNSLKGKDYQMLLNQCMDIAENNYNIMYEICKTDPIKEKFLQLNYNDPHYEYYKELVS